MADQARRDNHHAVVLAEALELNPGRVIPLRHELTKPGDEARLRGIPAIGRSVAGAIPGSNPESETINRLMRADRLRQATTIFKPQVAA